MLIAFFGFIERNNVTQFCGHNILGFDLPFIKHRSIINNVKPPAVLVDAFNAKQWSGNVLDTMLMWSQDKQKMISLDKLCRILGIECEIDFDGSMVANEWISGDKQKVIDYCICKMLISLDRHIKDYLFNRMQHESIRTNTCSRRNTKVSL